MSSRSCDCCGRHRCNKFYRIPVGKPVRRIFRVCGRCVVMNAQATRKWLDEQEAKLT